MSTQTQLFLVPTTSLSVNQPDGSIFTYTAPEYTQGTDPLAGVNYVSMALGGSGVMLVATAPNAALAAETDIFAFPVDLSSAMTDADIAALSTVLGNFSVPTDFLVAGITYSAAARTIASIAQVLQKAGPAQLGNVSLGKSSGIGTSQSSAELLASAAQVSGPLELNLAGSRLAL